MNCCENTISFESQIKFVNQKVFDNKTAQLNPKIHRVGYPWTPDTMIRGRNLYTTEILDCIAGGIVDGSKVTMFHFCTRNQKQAKRTKQKGFDIKNIERRILEKINLANENLHALILGGIQMKEDSKYNHFKLNKIKQIFERNNIPYTIFGARRDVHYFGRYSIFYKNNEDTWYITNNLTTAKDLYGRLPEVDIREDSIAYNTYATAEEGYKPTRRETDLKDYFKSQFREVSLCKMDRFA